MPARPAQIQTQLPSHPPYSSKSLSATSTPTLYSPLPSSLPRTPHPSSSTFPGCLDALKTPITPPSAYTDFLKHAATALQPPSPRVNVCYTPRGGYLTPVSSKRGSLVLTEPVRSAGVVGGLLPISPEVSDEEEDEDVKGEKKTRRISMHKEGDRMAEKAVEKAMGMQSQVVTKGDAYQAVGLLPAPKGKRRRVQ